MGFDITRLRNWRFIGYGDIFYFSGYKYGLGDATRTLGYDAMAEIQYHQSQMTNHQWSLSLRARARKKGASTYSVRATFDWSRGGWFDWSRGGWSLRTTADANLTNQKSTITNQQSIPYGVSIAQDIAYDFQSPMTNHQLPIRLKLRLQAFDAREWKNRIYIYEHDVLSTSTMYFMLFPSLPSMVSVAARTSVFVGRSFRN